MRPSLATKPVRCRLQNYAQAEIYEQDESYAHAISGYRFAGAAFENAAAFAEVNMLRNDIDKNGYAQYADVQADYVMAEDKYAAAQDLWLRGSFNDVKASTDALRQAKDLYARVDIKGAELRAYEGKDRAVQAQEAARAVKADLNAPDEYGLGEELMAQADAKMQEK